MLWPAGGMSGVDVVVPARRTATVPRLLRALSRGDRTPALVSLVGNEIPESTPTYGLRVRLLRVRSDAYAVGDLDVALRRNVGAWASPCSRLLFLDDDVVPARNTLDHCAALLDREPVVWGHYRYIDFSGVDPVELLDLPPDRGRSREHGVNRWHGWQSCYGGMFGIHTQVFVGAGGFDMVYSGWHSGEDQDLGRRLALNLRGEERIFIHEPPFAWHPVQREPWSDPGWTNLCPGGHARTERDAGGIRAEGCDRCPWMRTLTEPPKSGRESILPFLADAVAVEQIWL